MYTLRTTELARKKTACFYSFNNSTSHNNNNQIQPKTWCVCERYFNWIVVWIVFNFVADDRYVCYSDRNSCFTTFSSAHFVPSCRIDVLPLKMCLVLAEIRWKFRVLYIFFYWVIHTYTNICATRKILHCIRYAHIGSAIVTPYSFGSVWFACMLGAFALCCFWGYARSHIPMRTSPVVQRHHHIAIVCADDYARV